MERTLMDRRLPLPLHLATAAAFVAAAIIASEHDAHALVPVDVEVGARVGVGTNPDSRGPNPYGFGLGGRGGVSIFHFYGGLSAIHYFGGSKDFPIGGQTLSVSASSTLLGLEVGYSITGIPLLTLRPQLGIGNASFKSGDSSNSHLYLEPGLTALVSLGVVYVGADANILVVPNVDETGTTNKSTFTAFTLHAQVGVHF